MTPTIFDPALSEGDAARLLELRSDYGPYRLTLGARTRYFRETYVYGGTVFLPGIEFFVEHGAFAAAARDLHRRAIIVPVIVYANILVPGQRLAVHTDLPEYRGADRRSVSQWLLLVMQHSSLFERWRLPIATAIAYAGGGQGGALVYYPDGPARPAQSYQPRHNTALMLDTDTIFHGVSVVEGDQARAQEFRPGVQIEAAGGDTWVVHSADGATTFAEYAADDFRYSVSWKAYCFADEAEQATWRSHADDLDLDTIRSILVKDLGRAGRLPGGEPPGTDEDLKALAEAAYSTTGWRDTELRRAGLIPPDSAR